jgi:hypothetical protein
MQHHAANQLNVEVTHVEDTAASFTDHGKGFDQNLIKRFLQRVVFLFFEALGAVQIVFLF